MAKYIFYFDFEKISPPIIALIKQTIIGISADLYLDAPLPDAWYTSILNKSNRDKLIQLIIESGLDSIDGAYREIPVLGNLLNFNKRKTGYETSQGSQLPDNQTSL